MCLETLSEDLKFCCVETDFDGGKEYSRLNVKEICDKLSFFQIVHATRIFYGFDNLQ